MLGPLSMSCKQPSALASLLVISRYVYNGLLQSSCHSLSPDVAHESGLADQAGSQTNTVPVRKAVQAAYGELMWFGSNQTCTVHRLSKVVTGKVRIPHGLNIPMVKDLSD